MVQGKDVLRGLLLAASLSLTVASLADSVDNKTALVLVLSAAGAGPTNLSLANSSSDCLTTISEQTSANTSNPSLDPAESTESTESEPHCSTDEAPDNGDCRPASPQSRETQSTTPVGCKSLSSGDLTKQGAKERRKVTPSNNDWAGSYFLPHSTQYSLADGSTWHGEDVAFREDDSSKVRSEFGKGVYKLRTTYEPISLLVVETAYAEKRVARQGDLFVEPRKDSFWQLHTTSSIADLNLTALTELAVGRFDPTTGEGFGQDGNHAFAFDVKGSLGAFQYGASYGSVGKNFKRYWNTKSELELGRDKAGIQVWGSWKFDDFTITTNVRQQHNNVDGDTSRPRFTDREAGMTLDYSYGRLPGLGYTLSYTRGLRESSNEPEEFAPYAGPTESFRNSLNYSSPYWQASVYSSHRKSADRLSGDRDRLQISKGISGTLQATRLTKLASSVGYTKELYKADGPRFFGRQLSLALHQNMPRKNMTLQASTSFNGRTATTRELDTKAYTSKAGLFWSWNKSAADTRTFHLDVMGKRLFDELHPENSNEEFSVGLSFNFRG